MAGRIKTILVLVSFAPLSALASVSITEIMYDPPASDKDREWIELQNIGTTSLDLSEWRFFEGQVNHKLKFYSGNPSLEPGEYAVIVSEPQVFLQTHPDFLVSIFDSTFSLNNTGEPISMKSKNGEVFSQVAYISETGGSGDGNSIGMISGVWVATMPTPGKQNIKYLPPVPEKVQVNAPKAVNSVNRITEAKSIAPTTTKTAGDVILEAEKQDSMLKWYFLLAGVVVMAISSYWLMAKENDKNAPEADEFKIIEDRD